MLGCLLLGNLFGLTMLMPHAYGTGLVTVICGALLGIGAAINRACVFGAVARFGSGEWAHLATTVGIFLGCLAVQSFGRQLPSTSVASGTVIFSAPVWITALLSLLIVWRAILLFRSPRTGGESVDKPLQALIVRATSFVWAPRAATITIGLIFFVLPTDRKFNRMGRCMAWILAQKHHWMSKVEPTLLVRSRPLSEKSALGLTRVQVSPEPQRPAALSTAAVVDMPPFSQPSNPPLTTSRVGAWACCVVTRRTDNNVPRYPSLRWNICSHLIYGWCRSGRRLQLQCRFDQ